MYEKLFVKSLPETVADTPEFAPRTPWVLRLFATMVYALVPSFELTYMFGTITTSPSIAGTDVKLLGAMYTGAPLRTMGRSLAVCTVTLRNASSWKLLLIGT
ncbi:hypothetical protein EGT86_30360 [Burkholderia pseudomallei]|nr:hypothetical protein EGT86_30360 [Burkholderia pseudomallei]